MCFVCWKHLEMREDVASEILAAVVRFNIFAHGVVRDVKTCLIKIDMNAFAKVQRLKVEKTSQVRRSITSFFISLELKCAFIL